MELSIYTVAISAALSKGQGTQYLRLLVPMSMPTMAFGMRSLKRWVLGPSGSYARRSPSKFDGRLGAKDAFRSLFGNPSHRSSKTSCEYIVGPDGCKLLDVSVQMRVGHYSSHMGRTQADWSLGGGCTVMTTHGR